MVVDTWKFALHPWKPTWHWKIPIFNRKYIFKWWIFHCHVSFRGGKKNTKQKHATNCQSFPHRPPASTLALSASVDKRRRAARTTTSSSFITNHCTLPTACLVGNWLLPLPIGSLYGYISLKQIHHHLWIPWIWWRHIPYVGGKEPWTNMLIVWICKSPHSNFENVTYCFK